MGIVSFVLVIAGIVTAIIVVVKNAIVGNSIRQQIKRAKKGKLNEEKIRRQLDTQIGKVIPVPPGFHQKDLQKLSHKISSLYIRNMNIAYVHSLNVNELLVFTECMYADLSVVTARGQKVNANRKFIILILVSFVAQRQEIVLRSDLYSDSHDKLLREAFRFETANFVSQPA